MRTRLLLKNQLKMTPQIVMSGHLLQATTTEIEQLVTNELAKNPALESVHPYHVCLIPNDKTGLSLEDLSESIPICQSALTQLAAQVILIVDPMEYETVVCLLHALDDYGYLQASSQELADQLNVTPETVERLIYVLHQLDPPGIGARTIQECLLIQCQHLESEGTDCRLARRILAEVWDDFIHQRWKRVAQILRIPHNTVEEACHFIAQNLYPYPLLMVRNTPMEDTPLSFPDLIIHRTENDKGFLFSLELPGAEWFELRISNSFESVLRMEQRILSTDEHTWMHTYIEQARLFIAALTQRWITLRRIGEYIIHRQADFLESGPLYLKPLTRREVASALNMHESTISRAVQGKVIQLPDGRLTLLSTFFDASLPAREAIRRLLSETPEPLSDREIAEHLSASGFSLARRTVAKYRTQLQISATYGRERGPYQFSSRG